MHFADIVICENEYKSSVKTAIRFYVSTEVINFYIARIHTRGSRKFSALYRLHSIVSASSELFPVCSSIPSRSFWPAILSTLECFQML